MEKVAGIVIGCAIMVTFTVGLVQMLRCVVALFSSAPARGPSGSVADMDGKRTINWSPRRGIAYVALAGLLGVSIGRITSEDSAASAANRPTTAIETEAAAVGAMEAAEGAASAGDRSASAFISPRSYDQLDAPGSDEASGIWLEGDTDTYFSNCSDARAAGAAPVREGDPGYAPHLDRDNDGVGCE
jgi:hypothetical protein